MLSPTLTQQLEHALRGLRYGSVQLVIHDAEVVRIERIERIRLPAAPGESDESAAQAGLTLSREATTTTTGQPTTPTEVRHGKRQED